jgi:hypothetical protein
MFFRSYRPNVEREKPPLERCWNVCARVWTERVTLMPNNSPCTRPGPAEGLRDRTDCALIDFEKLFRQHLSVANAKGAVSDVSFVDNTYLFSEHVSSSSSIWIS